MFHFVSVTETLVQGKHAVILGDSNTVGMPLAMLLRDSGAATLTICHRVAFTELFDSDAQQRREIGKLSKGEDFGATRATVDACLPQLPGPHSATVRGPRSYRWTSQRVHPPARVEKISAAPSSLNAAIHWSTGGDRSGGKGGGLTVSVEAASTVAGLPVGPATVRLQVRCAQY